MVHYFDLRKIIFRRHYKTLLTKIFIILNIINIITHINFLDEIPPMIIKTSILSLAYFRRIKQTNGQTWKMSLFYTIYWRIIGCPNLGTLQQSSAIPLLLNIFSQNHKFLGIMTDLSTWYGIMTAKLECNSNLGLLLKYHLWLQISMVYLKKRTLCLS